MRTTTVGSAAWLVGAAVFLDGCATRPSVHEQQSDAAPDAVLVPDAEAPAPQALGATVHPGGTMFRVWAPKADHIFVAGDWNGWDDAALELAREGNGLFAIDVPGVGAGEQYRFSVDVGGKVRRRTDPRARAVTSSRGASIVVDPAAYAWSTAAFRPAPFAEQVIYELHIGTFNDSPGGQPGTWASAREKLGALAELGINVIEVMPPAEFAGDFSWGYNPAEPFAPESAYGSPEDIRAFIDDAHRLGIAVLIDVVHNHWGPSDLSSWCFDGCDGGGGSYFYSGDWAQTPWGPRPNFDEPQVAAYIVDNALMWLGELQCDGLRWDATWQIRSADGAADIPAGWALLRRMNDAVDAAWPDKIQLAEDFHDDGPLTVPTSDGGAGFDAQWDGGFFHPVDDTILAAADATRSMWAIRDALVHSFGPGAARRVIYTESHDEVANGKKRIPEMISPDDPGSYLARKLSTLGAAITLTAPGIPMLFQGQEMLEDGWFADDDPLDWSKAETYAGIRKLYADLIHLRRNVDGTTRGLAGDQVKVFHVNDAAKVVAYHRWVDGGPGDDVVVVANFSHVAFPSYEIGFPHGGLWRVRLHSDRSVYSADFADATSADPVATDGRRDGLAFHGTVGLGAYSVLVLSQ